MENTPQKPKKRHRPALIALVVVAALVCVGMGWWQLDRFESASGTAQNLGYALQWPVFAIAFVWAYRRFVMLEADPDSVETERSRSGPTEIPAGILPERPTAADPSVAALDDDADDHARSDYNRYLAGFGGESDARPLEKDQE
ncbi:transcriptional regulator [Gordonia alkaliphila]|uniref:transcriptional regulator n=1 Tax=Gordonia alkaliphila TaxID=1053547 RepID=UPI001FF1974C|nr:transcriptional regulator [Gordonia alkaliphila]MCK0440176.1 transcriptional regulator [Gordonia alkaliphila]